MRKNNVIYIQSHKAKKIKDLYKTLKTKELEQKMTRQVNNFFESYYLTNHNK